jgi:uncharacterized membrane protein
MDWNSTDPYMAALLVMCGVLVVAGIAIVVYTSRQTTARAKRLIAEGKMEPRKKRPRRKKWSPDDEDGSAVADRPAKGAKAPKS